MLGNFRIQDLKYNIIRAVLDFFRPPASRAGKVEKLPAQIETYQPKKNERGTFFVAVHMTAFLAGSLRSREYGRYDTESSYPPVRLVLFEIKAPEAKFTRRGLSGGC